MITGEKELAKIGDNLFFDNIEAKTTEEDQKRTRIASLIVLKSSKLAKKHKKNDIADALGYSYGGCKHLYDINHLIEKDNYRLELLEIILKQIEYIENIDDLSNVHIYQSMVFRIERIYYTRYSGKRKEFTKKLKQLFGDHMGRLSQDIPKKLQEYNNELCIYKENDKWYVDKSQKVNKTSPIGETWKDYKKTLLTPEERKEIDKKTSIDPIEETIRKRIELTKKSLEQAEKDLEYHLLLKRKYSEAV